jgi:hypothetical protein
MRVQDGSTGCKNETTTLGREESVRRREKGERGYRGRGSGAALHLVRHGHGWNDGSSHRLQLLLAELRRQQPCLGRGVLLEQQRVVLLQLPTHAHLHVQLRVELRQVVAELTQQRAVVLSLLLTQSELQNETNSRVQSARRHPRDWEVSTAGAGRRHSGGSMRATLNRIRRVNDVHPPRSSPLHRRCQLSTPCTHRRTHRRRVHGRHNG